MYRQHIHAFVAAITLLALLSCGPAPSTGQHPAALVIAIQPGTLDPDLLQAAYVQPFQADTGIAVTIRPVSGYDEVRRLVEAGGQDVPDIYLAPDLTMGQAAHDRVIDPIDWNRFENADLVPTAVHAFGVGAYAYASVMFCNSNALGDRYPTSWQDFWDIVHFPGTRSLRRGPLDNLEWALAAGNAPVRNLSLADVTPALASLQRLQPMVQVWWQDSDEVIQAVASGQVAMASGRSDAVVAALSTDPQLYINWRQAIVHLDYWTIVRGAPHREAAMQFVRAAMDARRQADLVMRAAQATPPRYGGYSPTARAAFTYIDRDLAANLITQARNYAQAIPFDVDWWSANLDDVDRQFEATVEGS
jgi:putative spermidine/putrescine transport system substrate-binding protein